MKSLLLITFALFIASIAHAQKPAVPVLPAFFSVETSSPSSLRISDIRSEIHVSGAFAETTLDLAYANSSHEALQGLFKIQLPQGSLVRDFALRIGEKWHYGSLTEKHKARQTFEEIVRRGADPAVLAWKDGSEYQVRIFPFPSRGKRWIRVKYWQDLGETGGRFVYRLPLPEGTKLDSFYLKLDARAEALSAVTVADAFSNRAYLRPIGEDKKSFGAMIDEKNFTVPGAFQVSVKASGAKETAWTARTTPAGDMSYLGAKWLQDLPAEPRALARKVLVFMDTSRSAKPDRPGQVAAWLKDFAGRLPRGTGIDYYEFDASVRKVRSLDPDKAGYDGGTSFAEVFQEIAKQRKSEGKDLDVVILSDFTPTMQREADLGSVEIKGARVFAVPVKNTFNAPFATAIVSRTDGAILPAIREGGSSLDESWRAYSTAPWKFLGLRAEGGTASDVLPEAGAIVGTSEPWVYFRARDGRAPRSVIATFGNGVRTLDLSAAFAEAKAVSEVESLWAMKKLESLVPDAEKLSRELMSHATRYRLVSPVTSYIVLELEDDYRRFNIAQRDENRADGSEDFTMAEESGITGMAAPAMEFSSARGNRAAAPMKARVMRKGGAFGGAGAGTVASDAPAEMAPVQQSVRAEPKRAELDRRSVPSSFMPPMPPPPRESMPVQKPAALPTMIDVADVMSRYTRSISGGKALREAYDRGNKPEMKDPWFYIEFASRLADAGEKNEALRVLSNLFEISEEDGKALRALGLLGCFQGNCDWAVQAFLMTIELRPEEPQNFRDLAWLYAELGRMKDARETLAKLKGHSFHSRFPGMNELLAREAAWFTEEKNAQASGFGLPIAWARKDGTKPGSYSWITWNNDNSDTDFHIQERSGSVVNYGTRNGEGQLSNDFTRGYGPEVYAAKGPQSPAARYMVNYFRADPSNEDRALIVKWSIVEDFGGGKFKVRSKVFPLYQVGQFVSIEGK